MHLLTRFYFALQIRIARVRIDAAHGAHRAREPWQLFEQAFLQWIYSSRALCNSFWFTCHKPWTVRQFVLSILRTPLDVFGRADSVSSVYNSIDDGCPDVSLEVLLDLQFGILLQSSFWLHLSRIYHLWFHCRQKRSHSQINYRWFSQAHRWGHGVRSHLLPKSNLILFTRLLRSPIKVANLRVQKYVDNGLLKRIAQLRWVWWQKKCHLSLV